MERTGRLTPGELAEAAVLADLTVLTIILARLTPFAGTTTIIGAIPFAVLGLRHRNRVLAVAFFVGVVLTFLMAGFSSASQLLVMATFGGVVGRSVRHGWSKTTTVTVALIVGWVSVASLTVGFLTLFAGFRELTIEAAQIQWTGLSNGLTRIGAGGFVELADPRMQWAFEHWYIAIPAFQFVISIAITLLIENVGTPAIRRVDSSFATLDEARAAHTPAVSPRESPEPRPVPVELRGVVVARGVSEIELPALEIGVRGFTVVMGPNGVGKSTLLGVLSDRLVAASGEIVRPGSVGLGLPGGTAVIGQRPESQIVGARVIDDLAWGLAQRPDDTEVTEVLGRVGLGGFRERETGSLSGGELQRLAIAGALLRRPALVLSDESTAMLDPGARARVLAVLKDISTSAAVVHVTHLENETDGADRVIRLIDDAERSDA